MMIKATIDWIEGEWLILAPESGPVFQIPEKLFPEFKEGDVVNIAIVKDEEGKHDTEERILELKKGLNKKYYNLLILITYL